MSNREGATANHVEIMPPEQLEYPETAAPWSKPLNRQKIQKKHKQGG